MKINFVEALAEISKDDWNKIHLNEYPFLKYDFLKSLEDTKCVASNKGWTPLHITVKDKNQIIGAMPMYVKTDSQGEFIFDWSWADAYYRNGLDYYPKLVSSIPFTPASGPRLLSIDKNKNVEMIKAVSDAMKDLTQENNFSSSHVLLANQNELDAFSEEGFSIRTSYSYHWFNNNYENFDHYLEDMTSRQRKNIKKERQKIHDQDVHLVRYIGEDITSSMLESFYQFYQVTYLKRGMRGYLNLEFFESIIKLIPESIMLVMAANKSGDFVAGAFNFYDDEKLYGRYWGCLEEYDSLHFETCYYQGIEFCIENALKSFDPGVQGEHKIKRGFCPIETYSAHWIRDIRFKEAIDDFLNRERVHILQYNEDRKSLLPFRKEIISNLYEKI